MRRNTFSGFRPASTPPPNGGLWQPSPQHPNPPGHIPGVHAPGTLNRLPPPGYRIQVIKRVLTEAQRQAERAAREEHESAQRQQREGERAARENVISQLRAIGGPTASAAARSYDVRAGRGSPGDDWSRQRAIERPRRRTSSGISRSAKSRRISSTHSVASWWSVWS